MAVTTENSTQMGKLLGTIPKMVETHEHHGRVRAYHFDFTQGAAAGDAGSLARMVKLPAGKVRLLLWQSRVYQDGMGSARTMDLGWEAYTDADPAVGAVAADPNGLDDGVDVAAAGAFTPSGTLGADEEKLFNSKEGVVLTLQVNDGTLPAGAVVKGTFLAVHD